MIGQEEQDAVLRVLGRGVLSGFQGNWSENFYGGEEIRALEFEWANYFGVKHAISCNSATSGLWMACAAIGLQSEDECIVSPYTMVCSASMPLHFKAKPIFADIEPDYYCLDVKSIEERITNKTKAIIVVDIFGQCYNADEINALAERRGKEYGHKIYVIEDAAQAAGAKYKGKYAGTLGDIGVYSLNVHKPIQCGEGGIVVTDDDELAFKLRLSMNHSESVVNSMAQTVTNRMIGNRKLNVLEMYRPGMQRECIALTGMNLRMTELSAAIAREQLKKLAGIIKIQQEHAKYFPVKVRENCEHAFYRYAFNRHKWYSKMDETIDYNFKQHYITPLYLMPLFKSLGYDQHCCPVCEQVEENIVLCWLKDMP
jgi:dTDP-4-amino-4,6-dideoxygalactose transaminase